MKLERLDKNIIIINKNVFLAILNDLNLNESTKFGLKMFSINFLNSFLNKN